MDVPTRHKWLMELESHRTKDLDAPSWLWASVVQLVASLEAAYLEPLPRVCTEEVKLLIFRPAPPSKNLLLHFPKAVSVKLQYPALAMELRSTQALQRDFSPAYPELRGESEESRVPSPR